MDHVLNHYILVRRLYELGFLHDRSLLCAYQHPPQDVARSIWAYQEWHGLKCDGWCGPKTRESLLAPRFCGHPDRMEQQSGGLCKWHDKQITWTLAGQLPGIAANDLVEAFQLAWNYWAEVCDIQPQWLPNERTANVTIQTGAIDGGLGTLAWSELPCGASPRTLKQLYDSNENWVIAEGITQGRQIDLVRVAAHEIGHVIGIPHIAAGNLLAPTYSPMVRKPQAGDIEEAVRRYGPRAGGPPPPAAAEEYVLTFRTPVTKLVIRRAA